MVAEHGDIDPVFLCHLVNRLAGFELTLLAVDDKFHANPQYVLDFPVS
jgi:hypothetical protein